MTQQTWVRRALPIREEDVLEIAMERFWAAPGGNVEGVRAVLSFAKAVFLDMGDEACAKIADEAYGEGPSGSYDNGGTRDGWDQATRQIAESIRARAMNMERAP